MAEAVVATLAAAMVTGGVQYVMQKDLADSQKAAQKEAEQRNREYQEKIRSEEKAQQRQVAKLDMANKERAAQAARLKSLAAKSQGRESTILSDYTQQPNQENESGQKTLLGM